MRRRGWTVLLLAPVLLSGCGAVGLSSAGGGGSAAGGGPSAGPGWVVVSRGSATPSARPSDPSTTPTPVASGFLPLRTPAPAPTRTPVSRCSPNLFDFSKIGPADVVPGRTSAVVSWYNVGGYNLVEFRITATSQDMVQGKQRDVGWLVVPPSLPCGQMSATITGLDRRTGYLFSVDAVVRRRSGDGAHAATVARSLVVSTT